MSRLLHNYSTAETLLIHDTLLANPNRVKGEDYCRARKALLLQELQKRFGERIKTNRGLRGEERLDVAPTTAESAALVAQSLDHFTPWNTPCVTPERPHDREDDENRIEVNRMHAILHPDCYRRITGRLSLDPPEKRLEIPRLAGASHYNENGSRGDRNSPPELSNDELAVAAAYLAAEAVRRKRVSAGLLRIVVDGVERGRLDTASDSALRLEVEEKAELVEVRALEGDGDVLLASFLPQHSGASAHTVVLEAGQRISFAARPLKDKKGVVAGVVLEVRYRETKVMRTVSLVSRRLRRFAESSSAFKPAVAFALLGFLAVGLTLWIGRSNPYPPIQGAAPRLEKKPMVPGDVPARENPSPGAISGSSQAPLPGTSSRPEPVSGPSSGEQGTRAVELRSPAMTLPNVKKVYVDCADRGLREAISRELRTTQVTVVEKQDEADAALHVRVTSAGDPAKESVSIAVRLVGPAGNTLWPTPQGAPERRYRGLPDDTASRVARDLLNAVQQGERRP